MSNAALQAYFKFDDADLEANRRGQFSEAQKARLAGLNKKDRIERWVLGCFLLGVMFVVLILAPNQWNKTFDFPVLIFPVGLAAGVIGFFVLRSTKKPYRKYKLKKMQGIVKYSRHKPEAGGPNFRNRIIHLNHSYFDVAEDMPTILQEGAEYAVYTYAFEATTYILTAEAINTDG
jgi:hypothetical protein